MARVKQPAKTATSSRKAAKKGAKKASGKKVASKRTARKGAAKAAKKTLKKVAKKAAKVSTSGAKKRRKARAEKGPSAVAQEVDAEVLEFIDAINRYKREYARPFPTWSEVLHVLRALGYRKVD